MALFAGELRQRFHDSTEHLANISEIIQGFFDKLKEESKKLERHASTVDEIQRKCIAEFEAAYEEQSRAEAVKLIVDMTTIVSNHLHRQKELVGTRLVDLRETVTGNKTFLDGHVSSMEGITTVAKRKWQDYSTEAGSSTKKNADFSAAKHCQMELIMQKCVCTAETARNHWQSTNESFNDMGSQHVLTMHSAVRNMCDSNEQHVTEFDSTKDAALEVVTRKSEDAIQSFDGLSEKERASISGILDTANTHSETLGST